VVQTLVEATRKVVESQEFKAFAKTVAIIPSFKTGSEFQAFLDQDDKTNAVLMKQTAPATASVFQGVICLFAGPGRAFRAPFFMEL
jgi:hypothetical protein